MKAEGIFIGTSGWTYNDWSGRFYPLHVKGADRLSFYASRFNTVEVNATYYRNPTEQMISAWNRRLEEDFHLVVKGPRTITHLKKIQDCEETLRLFLGPVLLLKSLRVILRQLPPSMHRDLDRLESFLTIPPKEVGHAVEFRQESWWDDQVVALLRGYNAVFVAVSHPRLPDTLYAAGDFLYVRFHGESRHLYRHNYSDDELSRWASILRPHVPGRALYAFFNNDYEANAPKNAVRLREMLGSTKWRG